jgi:CheY-like chemotaxis protein
LAVKTQILIVEDDISIRDSLAQLLVYEGYDVIGASNGQEGLESVKISKPCVILLDLMMPVMDGWQFSDHLNADPDLSRIPVIIISAHEKVSEISKDLRAQGFVKKPINVDQLLETVKLHCSL